MAYLSKRALSGLRDYKYKPGGYTVLDEWHQPFWNYTTEHILPRWLAPNLITLMGLFALVGAYAVAAWYLPELEGAAPTWLHFMSGTAVLFYLHMDCLDGKQARRTRNSSPLGQLFDHGCDALALHLILTNVCCSFNLAAGWRVAAGTLCCMIPFMLAHWEEYHTGTMVYGNGLVGVTEANYAVVALHYAACFIRPYWRAHVLAPLVQPRQVRDVLPPVAVSFLQALQLNEVVILTILSLALKMSSEQLVRVFRLAGSKQLEHTTLPRSEHGHKQLGRCAAAQHLLQILLFFMLGLAVMLLPAEAPGQARVVLGTYGVAYALQTTRLIMAHMAKEPFEVAVWPMAVVAMQVANAWLRALDPVLLAYAANAVMVVGYLHYVVLVINEICAFLKIPCLTIRKVED